MRPTARRASNTSTNAVVEAAAEYLVTYQQQFSFLLADEVYTQRVLDSGGNETARRVTTGESFLTYVPADHAWIFVRDVAAVDGRPISDRQDIQSLLEREPPAGAARRLASENARFNIGSITRNFSEPTLGLLVLEPEHRPRLKFDRKRVAPDGDVQVVTIAFKESVPPTLVHTVHGGDIYSHGDLDIEAGTGRVRRTLIQMSDGPVKAELTTTFANDANLGMWVPTVMTERYEQVQNEMHETVLCDARYTNYRRFGASVKIK